MSLDLWLENDEGDELASINITHNLNDMARECGIYNVMWRPELHGIRFAKDMIPELAEGIKELISNKTKYEKYDASNGWGLYDDLLDAAICIARECNNYPLATVGVSR